LTALVNDADRKEGPVLSLEMSLGVCLGLAALALANAQQIDSAVGSPANRPFTVADAIRMNKISGTAFAAVNAKSGFATFSPNGRWFTIVVRRGNIERNTNDYSMLLFRTAEVFHHPRPRLLLSISSSSNNAGISDLNWLEDSDTILFLASRGSEPTQLYAVRRSSGELHTLTNRRTSVTSYAVSKGGQTIVYAAERAEGKLIGESVLRNGLHVSRESVTSLLRSRLNRADSPNLFVIKHNDGQSKQLRTLDEADMALSSSMLSPDGHYLVVKTDMSKIPEKWREYQDPIIQQLFRRTLPEGFPTGMLHFELIDTRTGLSEVLLNSPASYEISDVLWSPDSKSVLLCNAFLPLSGVESKESDSRRRSRYAVEITVSDSSVVKVAEGNLAALHWNPRTAIVQFEVRHSAEDGTDIPGYAYYQKGAEGWRQLSSVSSPTERQPEIIAEQDLNFPPRVLAVDPRTKRHAVLLEPNSQFATLRLGKVQKIDWIVAGGRHISGGMYLPTDYVAGTRYPLVIQTHGFREKTFIVDGPHMTASAAQPLANKGFIVLQLRDILPEWVETPSELQRAMQEYEDAIDYLDQQGMVDRNRVGIVGFSRTCMYVKYALTHSTHHFAAAIVSDGVDAGYVQYLLFYNVDPLGAADSEAVIGEAPFGKGLRQWLEESPGFGLDRVQTPLQIQALGADSVLTEWEWFAGLKRLQKPVDLVYLPAASHILVKPWDRLVSQQGMVDWFCFWLKGEEDPDAQKAKQYALWRKLRAQSRQ